MTIFLTGALVAALIGVVAVLIAGVVVMGRGGDANRRLSNKLMRLRVALQLVAIVALLLLFFTSRGGTAA